MQGMSLDLSRYIVSLVPPGPVGMEFSRTAMYSGESLEGHCP
jgi:hypothetical protein